MREQCSITYVTALQGICKLLAALGLVAFDYFDYILVEEVRPRLKKSPW